MGTFDSLLEDHGGNLKNLLGKFESSGLGDKVKSVVGNGPDEPIDADDVKRALGPKVRDLAAKLGIGEDEAAEKLARPARRRRQGDTRRLDPERQRGDGRRRQVDGLTRLRVGARV